MMAMDRKHLIFGVVLLCSIVFGAGYKMAQGKEKIPVKTPGIVVNTAAGMPKKQQATITVHITGAVKKPGVYTLPEGARVIDGLRKAEPAGDADINMINLAEVVSDQDQIVVPDKGDPDITQPRNSGTGSSTRRSVTSGRTGVSQGSSGVSYGKSGVAQGTSGKININTAEAGELDKLPGVGPAIAQKIVEYRTQQGKFKKVSDLLNVPGIGEKKFSKLKEQIKV